MPASPLRYNAIGRRVVRLAALCVATLLCAAVPGRAQDEQVPSKCVAIANALPSVTYASFTPAQAFVDGPVRITYAGHSTYVLETPGGVRIATDYSGVYGGDPLPDVVTMNKAHRTDRKSV